MSNALIIVHANGAYDVSTKTHQSNETVGEQFYKNLSEAVCKAIERNDVVFYTPNYYTTKGLTEQDIQNAIDSDPLIKKLEPGVLAQMIIVPDGRETPNTSQIISIEDEIVNKCEQTIVCGLYYDWCVKAVANAIMGRNKFAKVYTSPTLSCYSSKFAENESSSNLF